MKIKDMCVRQRLVLLGGAAVYALLFALGSQIDTIGTTDAGATALRFALALPAALAVLYALFVCLPGRAGLRRAAGAPSEKPFFTAGAFVLIAAAYAAMFLIQYPGSFMYDTQRQVFQIARNDYEQFHPLAHTLLIRACLSMYGVLQSFEKCAALYSVIQLTVMAGCYALLCAGVSRCASKKAAWATAVFFALYPSHMAFASNCTKDGLFSAFFALFFAYCVETLRRGRLTRLHAALQLLCGVMACLLRNNMVYAMAAWAVLLLLGKKKYLRLVVCCVLAVALSRGANAALVKMTDARDGSMIEMFSVPIQQLSRARLYSEASFTDEQKALMDEVFADALYDDPVPLYERYEPTLADPVKNYIDEALFRERLPELMKMWADVGAACPGVYLDAFLHMALPSLYPYSDYRVVHPYIETGLQPGVVTAPFGAQPMSQPGVFEGIRTWMQTNLFDTGADDIPLVRLLFNTGAVYWALLAFVLYDMYRGDWSRVLIFMLPVLLWGTYLLGPVMQGRYLYPFICCLPLFALRGARTGMKQA